MARDLQPQLVGAGARTNSCRLGSCAFQPNRPIRPSLRAADPAPTDSSGWLAAIATRTSEGMSSIRPTPKEPACFARQGSERSHSRPRSAADRSRSRWSGVVCSLRAWIRPSTDASPRLAGGLD